MHLDPLFDPPMPNELPTGKRCAHCFAVCNPDGTCPEVSNHVPNMTPSTPASDPGAFDRIGLKILSDYELAQAINTSPNTLMTWRANGHGPAYAKLGKRVFYRVDAVIDWIKSCEKHNSGA